MSHLYEAVSGKRTAAETKQLMTGVSLIARQDANFRVVRSDGAELLIPRDSERGQRMFSCMEKLERQARNMVGDDLGNYIKSLDALVIEGNSVILRHSGEERVTVPLPSNQPWLPVSLKELRLKNIRLRIEEGAENDVHRIREIDGIVTVVNSAGIDLAIEPREFWRYKDKRGRTHIVFGIKSLIPEPVRHLLHMPEVMRVNFTVRKRKHQDHQQT
jgi:hypothetical protein